MKTLENPLKTTVKDLKKPTPEFMRVVRRIQQKVITYGICSDDEERVLAQHTNYTEHSPHRR